MTGLFLLFAFDEGLLTANMFPATHPQDTLYYITNTWEKLGFDQSADTLLLSGNLDAHTGVIDEFSKFIAKVEQTELHPTNEPFGRAASHPAHRYSCHAMRIISGKYRSRRIAVPASLKARPTTDFAKEGLFNVLNNIVDWEETSALDLFSGTGNIAFELIFQGMSPRG